MSSLDRAPRDARFGADAPGAGIVFSDVSKRYRTRRGGTVALAGVDLVVDREQFVAVIGPSGCGKSTLLRIAAGLIEADGGEVSVYGRSPAEAGAEKQIGLVPQSPALLPWRSVLDNVRLPLEVNRRVATPKTARDPVAVLEAVGLGAVLDRRPAELSGGMQQRVAIARAFVYEPSVLLMDEPFASLDELTREDLRAQLLALWQNDRKTVLFVTHSVVEAIVLADVVVVMSAHPGRVHALFEVPLARPRDDLVELSDEFRSLEREVRLALRFGSAASFGSSGTVGG